MSRLNVFFWVFVGIIILVVVACNDDDDDGSIDDDEDICWFDCRDGSYVCGNPFEREDLEHCYSDDPPPPPNCHHDCEPGVDTRCSGFTGPGNMGNINMFGEIRECYMNARGCPMWRTRERCEEDNSWCSPTGGAHCTRCPDSVSYQCDIEDLENGICRCPYDMWEAGDCTDRSLLRCLPHPEYEECVTWQVIVWDCSSCDNRGRGSCR